MKDPDVKHRVTYSRRADDGSVSTETWDCTHLAICTGLHVEPNMPDIPGIQHIKGQILHSTQHNKATDHAGKKVVVVGACTSGTPIDIASPAYDW